MSSGESGSGLYIWENPGWPRLRYDLTALAAPLAAVHASRGHLMRRMADVGLSQRDATTLLVLTDDVVKTSEIEGERLDPETVRSSVARRLGLDIGALAPADRHVDGVVDMVLDATGAHVQPLTRERLFGWHAALFPTGYSGLSPIRTGARRDDASGPMQVVSGPVGRRKVHFEAPPAPRLDAEMSRFVQWFEQSTEGDRLVHAGLAHLWFVTLHPFDDGNGRIARAVGDMALARADRSGQRFYSLAAQIQRERKDYYEMLERTQKGSLDVTPWLEWFLGCLLRAVQGAEASLSAVLLKFRAWQRWAELPLNERQIKLLNRLLDGFEGKLTSSKWAAIAKCSADTALRDIGDLVARGVLKKSESGGRSTSYELVMQP
ncbi:mobile mystery protein B [Variovorax sp. PBS-H4]|uniref:Fic family protein n=1 Tax=Variovorax sp. PBS-H4 TaxID=434008 RepID=UPI001317CFB6|nr:Fic family protein [Variovorax sp. PBS-H4]VTU18602.1 mobile mystery protein B [Variovorax sp. PBS-H4]